jgi:xanthine dehydrogenase YagS FAD-binding subunit
MTVPVFGYRRAKEVADAVSCASAPGAMYLAGGTELLQLWKAGVAVPREVVDISRLPLKAVEETGDGLSIGALAKLSDVARHPIVRQQYPLVAQAIEASASRQVRNMATIGGNLLQRSRCVYFRSAELPCNKRAPGSGCGALAGENRQAALFATSDACVASHPSDLAVALIALNAHLAVRGKVPSHRPSLPKLFAHPSGAVRRLSLRQLYRPPEEAPERDTTLAHGELLEAVHLPDAKALARRSMYLKLRDRASFEFAVVSVAAALWLDGGRIADVRLAAGGVAPMPWRLSASEAALSGHRPSRVLFEAAAAAAIVDARPLAHNGFKVGLLRVCIVRALETICEAP